MPKGELLQLLSEELIIELTKQMVAIPTPNPPGQENACAEFILQQFEQWASKQKEYPSPIPDDLNWWLGFEGQGRDQP